MYILATKQNSLTTKFTRKPQSPHRQQGRSLYNYNREIIVKKISIHTVSKITHLTRMNIYSFIYLFFTNYLIVLYLLATYYLSLKTSTVHVTQ